MLSDWIDSVDDYSKLLKVASLKFDLISIRFLDPREKNLPNFGLLTIEDPETGHTTTIDTRTAFKDTRIKDTRINTFLTSRIIEQNRVFKKYKIDLLEVDIGQSFITHMTQFFHNRTRKQI